MPFSLKLTWSPFNKYSVFWIWVAGMMGEIRQPVRQLMFKFKAPNIHDR
jgi:hypothetical protein